MIKELQKLNPTKVTQETDTPVNIFKDNKEFFAGYFQKFFNDAIASSKFPSSLKMANIKAVFKKGTKSLKKNYRPISILPLVSKIFERIICKQLTTFFDNILSKYQCGFRKGHGTQHCLLLMLEK